LFYRMEEEKAILRYLTWDPRFQSSTTSLT
jgi:hypothetical protein